MRAHWVGPPETPVLSFSRLRSHRMPKFTKFSTHAQEIGLLLFAFFAKPFTVGRYAVPLRRYLRSFPKSIPNSDVLGSPNFWEGAPNFWPHFINSGNQYHRTCVKIWWRSTERPRRLGAENEKKNNQTTSQKQKSLSSALLKRSSNNNTVIICHWSPLPSLDCYFQILDRRSIRHYFRLDHFRFHQLSACVQVLFLEHRLYGVFSCTAASRVDHTRCCPPCTRRRQRTTAKPSDDYRNRGTLLCCRHISFPITDSSDRLRVRTEPDQAVLLYTKV